MRLEDVDVHDPARYVEGVPHEAFALLRREAPVFWQAVPGPHGPGYWALSRHADVMRVSRDPETFSSYRKGVMNFEPAPEQLAMLRAQLLCMDPPEHNALRRKVHPAFAPAALDALEPRAREIVGRVLDAAVEAGDCDFVDAVAAEVPTQVFGEVMDCPPADRPRLRAWAAEIVRFNEPDYDDEAGRGAAAEMGAYAYELAQARRGGAGRDLVTLLVNAQEEEGAPLDEGAFAGLFVQFAVAGQDTTRSLLAGTAQALAEHPEAWAALEADPSLVPTAVEELLRWTTPLHCFRRTATRDVTLHGTTIREGDAVVMLYASANRDEAVFDAPHRLDLRRDPNPHLAFGWGEHFCLGARLARMEARLFLEALLERVARVELAGKPRGLHSNVFNGPGALPVRLHPR